MVLILGALGAGKRAYARSLGYREEQISQDLEDNAPVLDSLEEIVRSDPEKAPGLLEKLLQKEVVICCEVGSGVVPIAKEDRLFREATGRLCTKLAQRASAVVRVIAGIPQVIKGAL